MGKRSRTADMEGASTLKRRGCRDFPKELASINVVIDEKKRVEIGSDSIVVDEKRKGGALEPKQENSGVRAPLSPKQEKDDCFFINQLASTPIVEEKRGIRVLLVPKQEDDSPLASTPIVEEKRGSRVLLVPKQEDDSPYLYPGRYGEAILEDDEDPSEDDDSPYLYPGRYGEAILEDDEDPSEDDDPDEEPQTIEEDEDPDEEPQPIEDPADDENSDEELLPIEDPDDEEESDEDLCHGYCNSKENEEDQKPTNSATPPLPANILQHYSAGTASAASSSSSGTNNATSPENNPPRQPNSTTLLNNTLGTVDPFLQCTSAYVAAPATNPDFLPKKFNEFTDEDLTLRLLMYGSAVADRLTRCQTSNHSYRDEINHLREALVMKEKETQQLAMEKAELQKNLQIEEMLQQGTTSRVRDLEREVATLKVENSRLINRLESYKV